VYNNNNNVYLEKNNKIHHLTIYISFGMAISRLPESASSFAFISRTIVNKTLNEIHPLTESIIHIYEKDKQTTFPLTKTSGKIK